MNNYLLKRDASPLALLATLIAATVISVAALACQTTDNGNDSADAVNNDAVPTYTPTPEPTLPAEIMESFTDEHFEVMDKAKEELERKESEIERKQAELDKVRKEWRELNCDDLGLSYDDSKICNAKLDDLKDEAEYIEQQIGYIEQQNEMVAATAYAPQRKATAIASEIYQSIYQCFYHVRYGAIYEGSDHEAAFLVEQIQNPEDYFSPDELESNELIEAIKIGELCVDAIHSMDEPNVQDAIGTVEPIATSIAATATSIADATATSIAATADATATAVADADATAVAVTATAVADADATAVADAKIAKCTRITQLIHDFFGTYPMVTNGFIQTFDIEYTYNYYGGMIEDDGHQWWREDISNYILEFDRHIPDLEDLQDFRELAECELMSDEEWESGIDAWQVATHAKIEEIMDMYDAFIRGDGYIGYKSYSFNDYTVWVFIFDGYLDHQTIRVKLDENGMEDWVMTHVDKYEYGKRTRVNMRHPN